MSKQLEPDQIPNLNVVIFISGRGSNMEALLKACEDTHFPAKVMCVISDKPDAKGLEIAKDYGVPTHIVQRAQFDNKHDFESMLLSHLQRYDFQCVCLAGFMRVLSEKFLNSLSDKTVINIHPSLLPKYKGLNVHERVLQDNEIKSGCTVHYVTADVDSGAIIVQKEVSVLPDDTPQSLAKRVLETEHVAYPEALRIVAEKSAKI